MSYRMRRVHEWLRDQDSTASSSTPEQEVASSSTNDMHPVDDDVDHQLSFTTESVASSVLEVEIDKENRAAEAPDAEDEDVDDDDDGEDDGDEDGNDDDDDMDEYDDVACSTSSSSFISWPTSSDGSFTRLIENLNAEI